MELVGYDAIEGQNMELKGHGRRRTQLLVDLRKKVLKEEAEDKED